MLHYSTIEPTTLELLRQLMSMEEFSETRLVGGTALALQFGHRKSIDIDLFGKINFDEIDIVKTFEGFRKVISLKRSQNINIFIINDIKVDIVNYSYPWLKDEIIIDNLRLAAFEDIAAMKIAAVTNRGSKKDFFDIFLLLNYLPLKDILSFYTTKYFDASPFLAYKSLSYFEDAEREENPVMMHKQSWNQVKKRILLELEKVQNPFDF